MIPKIDFQIHEAFINAFKPIDQSVEDITLSFQQFIEEFEEKEEKILQLIQKYSGYEFTKARIPVYLTPISKFGVRKSFARLILEDNLPGVVLKIFPSNHFTEFIFIHELTHINNMHNKKLWETNPLFVNPDSTRNLPGAELCADIVTLFVLRELYGENSQSEQKLWKFLITTDEVNKDKYNYLKEKLVEWDLNQKPLKEYIEN